MLPTYIFHRFDWFDWQNSLLHIQYDFNFQRREKCFIKAFWYVIKFSDEILLLWALQNQVFHNNGMLLMTLFLLKRVLYLHRSYKLTKRKVITAIIIYWLNFRSYILICEHGFCSDCVEMYMVKLFLTVGFHWFATFMLKLLDFRSSGTQNLVTEGPPPRVSQ